MGDLISRQDAINLMGEWSGGFDYIETSTESAIEEIKQLPSAQPERKKGLWLFEKSSGKHFCSHCGEYANADIHNEEILSVYCPICGTKMEGAEAAPRDL